MKQYAKFKIPVMYLLELLLTKSDKADVFTETKPYILYASTTETKKL